jgi:hypothetical protein
MVQIKWGHEIKTHIIDSFFSNSKPFKLTSQSHKTSHNVLPQINSPTFFENKESSVENPYINNFKPKVQESYAKGTQGPSRSTRQLFSALKPNASFFDRNEYSERGTL